MAKKAKADRDPYKLHEATAACGVEGGYFRVVDQGSGRATLWDANQKDLFTGSAASVKAFAAGVARGCMIGAGRGHAAARQLMLGGEATKAPKPPRRFPGLGQLPLPAR